jgi:DNA-binding transcriptional LysR family regulator
MRHPYYKDIRYEHFRTFCELVRQASFAATGTVLGLSRTTVWQQLETLERELQARLFRRHKRSLELTDEGRLLLEMVSAPMTTLAGVKEVFRARVQAHERILRIAGVQGVEVHTATLRFREAFANVHFKLVERRSSDVYRMVQDGECDLGICLYASEMPIDPIIYFEQIGKRDLTLITATSHPLAHKRRLGLADLVRFPLILGERDNPWRIYIVHFFERAGLASQMRVVIDSDSLETHEEGARLGLGVGICLPSPGRQPAAGVHFRSLARLLGAAPEYVIWKKGAYLLPHVARFVDLLKATMKELSPRSAAIV